MKKSSILSLPVAIVILSISILFASFMISNAINNIVFPDNSLTYTELSRFNDNVEILIEMLQKKMGIEVDE